jgi:hypothetical protein
MTEKQSTTSTSISENGVRRSTIALNIHRSSMMAMLNMTIAVITLSD